MTPNLLTTMNTLIRGTLFLSFFFFPILTIHPLEGSTPWKPPAVMVSWVADPLRTAVVDWHSHGSSTTRSLQYRQRGSGETWRSVSHTSIPYPFPSQPNFVHRAHLRGLTPGSEVEFRWGSGSQVYYFRTMPERLERPLRMVVGGDVRHRKDWMDRVNREAMKSNPDFIVWGGDLAYADGRESRLQNWLEWFSSIQETLVAEDGRIVPIIVGIGNHEVREMYVRSTPDYRQDDATRARIAPYFYTFFAFPGQPGYRALDFGNYLSLLILDTGHSNPVEGVQTTWLRDALRERANVTHVIPIYHVPAYPSHRSFNDPLGVDIRTHWVPLFEEFDVALAFEHHDHAYKRTFPLLRGRVDFSGVVYVGDGAWGVETRMPALPSQRWYLAQSSADRHYILAKIEQEEIRLQVVDEWGNSLDGFTVPADEADHNRAVSQIFPRSINVRAGVWENDWLGQFHALRFPWIYHEQHRWLFASGRGDQGIWFYDANQELHWFWTNYQTYPHIFHGRDRSWYFFNRDSGGDGNPRWFYRFGSPGEWFSIPVR